MATVATFSLLPSSFEVLLPFEHVVKLSVKDLNSLAKTWSEDALCGVRFEGVTLFRYKWCRNPGGLCRGCFETGERYGEGGRCSSSVSRSTGWVWRVLEEIPRGGEDTEVGRRGSKNEPSPIVSIRRRVLGVERDEWERPDERRNSEGAATEVFLDVAWGGLRAVWAATQLFFFVVVVVHWNWCYQAEGCNSRLYGSMLSVCRHFIAMTTVANYNQWQPSPFYSHGDRRHFFSSSFFFRSLAPLRTCGETFSERSELSCQDMIWGCTVWCTLWGCNSVPLHTRL